MAIEIIRILKSIDEKLSLAEVNHYGEILKVFLYGEVSKTERSKQEEVTFEMNYKRILNWKVIESNEEKHGIFSCQDNIVIRGEVHNRIETGDDTIIDIYIAKGPEFISVLGSELDGHVPEDRESIELIVEGLCIHPVGY